MRLQLGALSVTISHAFLDVRSIDVLCTDLYPLPLAYHERGAGARE
jgi:hypothetical protein